MLLRLRSVAETDPMRATATSRRSGNAVDDHAPRWHATPADAGLESLGTDRDGGLSDAEVQARLEHYGPNRLPAPVSRSVFRRLVAQFHNVLIYVLLGAAALTAALGHWVDSGVIPGVSAASRVAHSGRAAHGR